MLYIGILTCSPNTCYQIECKYKNFKIKLDVTPKGYSQNNHFTSSVKKKTKLHGLSPRANYTDRATASCREVIANFCG
jgi:hypothetical protein